ncbi:MAG: YqaA family protein [Bdellovibrionales bacterium]
MTDSKAEIAKNNPLRRLYVWSMNECEKPYSFWFLSAFAYLESIIIPIPTDPLLIAKATAAPKKALSLSFWISIFSVLGGITGYFIGSLLWEALSPFIFEYLISENVFDTIKARFSESVFLFVVLGGLTPLPFKAFALTAGSMQLPLLPFTLGCVVGRGARFLLIGLLVHFFGAKIKAFMDKWLEAISIILGLLVALLILIKYLN